MYRYQIMWEHHHQRGLKTYCSVYIVAESAQDALVAFKAWHKVQYPRRKAYNVRSSLVEIFPVF